MRCPATRTRRLADRFSGQGAGNHLRRWLNKILARHGVAYPTSQLAEKECVKPDVGGVPETDRVAEGSLIYTVMLCDLTGAKEQEYDAGLGAQRPLKLRTSWRTRRSMISRMHCISSLTGAMMGQRASNQDAPGPCRRNVRWKLMCGMEAGNHAHDHAWKMM